MCVAAEDDEDGDDVAEDEGGEVDAGAMKEGNSPLGAEYTPRTFIFSWQDATSNPR